METYPKIHCADGITARIPEDLREMQITPDWLKDKAACAEGFRWFIGKFPNGCTYTQLRVAIADEKQEGYEAWIIEKLAGDVATAGYRGTATAGDRGTATAGYSGTATAGDSGTATAGYSGTATAGDSGTATAGDRGTATAGYRGTATAGYSGTATAGDSGTATAGDSGTATAGDSGTATAGDSGTATAGYRGTATAGDSGTATAGDSGTATAGDRGTATAGEGGIITIEYWDDASNKYRRRVGIVGENGIKPNVKYRLNSERQFEEVTELVPQAEPVPSPAAASEEI